MRLSPRIGFPFMMIPVLCLMVVWLCPISEAAAAPTHPVAQTTRLLYRTPADLWTDALPLGNGRLGAMVYGRIHEEIIQLNEDTVWAGGPYNGNRPDKPASLAEIRRLVFEGKGREAEALFEKTMMSRTFTEGGGYDTAPYQPLGRIKILSPGHIGVVDYQRELLLDKALSRVSYTIDGVKFTRTAFCSAPDDVLVVRLQASKPSHITCYIQLEGFTNPRKTGDEEWGVRTVDDNQLILFGKTRSYPLSEHRLRYEGNLKAINEAGSISIIFKDNMPMIKVEKADSVVLLFAAATNFRRYDDLSNDPGKRNLEVLNAVALKTYDRILSDHIADFGALFNRVSLHFDAHPPFQIDGNFGATAGIAEMLLQSHNRYLAFLPALPDAWPRGFVKGLCARGAFDVDIEWKNSRWAKVRILSKMGNPCTIRHAGMVSIQCRDKEVPVSHPAKDLIRFPTEAGRRYVLRNKRKAQEKPRNTAQVMRINSP